jgi:hypothetical protein
MHHTRLLSSHAQKAVFLLRGHYVFVRMLRPTGFRGGGRVPEYAMAYRVINTHSGAEVLGLGEGTFRELWQARLLDVPAKFPSRYPELRRRRQPWSREGYTEDVYTLNSNGPTAVLVAAVIKATDLRNLEEEWYA